MSEVREARSGKREARGVKREAGGERREAGGEKREAGGERENQKRSWETEREINAMATADIPISPIPQANPANRTGAYRLHRSTPNRRSSEYLPMRAPNISGMRRWGSP